MNTALPIQSSAPASAAPAGGPAAATAAPDAPAGRPAPDFAQLLGPITAAGSVAMPVNADPNPLNPATTGRPVPQGASTRLKLAVRPSREFPSVKNPSTTPTQEQVEAAAAMLAPFLAVSPELPPAFAAPALSLSPDLPATMPGDADCPTEGMISVTGPAASTVTLPQDQPLAPSRELPTEKVVLNPPAAAPADEATRPAQTEKLPATPAEPAPAPVLPAAALPAAVLPAAPAESLAVVIETIMPTQGTLSRLPRPGRSATMPAQAEKNAASPGARDNPAAATDHASIKNFLSVEAADDGTGGPEVGIGVAQPTAVMPAHTTERLIPADPVAQPLLVGVRTDTASTSGLADIREHRPATIARRAVEAVVGVVEVQIAARLRSAPAVQLQLKLGGENLSIRVELREGNVHTQFRTDSPEICQAIAREWNAMRAESPEQALRYLKPEFPAGDAGSSPGGSGQQEHASHQSARQPLPEIFGGLGRSYPYSQTEPDSPVLEIATLLQPTSGHLSAVA